MGKNRYQIRIGAVALALGVLVWACTKKAEFVNPPTKLNIRVYDDKGKAFKKVKVAIFSDYAKYNIAKDSYNVEGGDFHDSTDAEGFVHFENVSSNIRYYVLCKYDSAITSTDTLTWSNTREDYQFLNPLKPNTVTTAEVFISVAEGFAQFWIDAGNDFVIKQPIYLRVGNKVDTLRLTGLNNGAKVKLNAGIYTYQGRSAYGCAWIDTINVVAGQKVTEKLSSCSLVNVTIGVINTSTAPSTKFPIRVVLNNTDTLSEMIKASIFSANGGINCGITNSISVVRPAGTYSYQLIGNDNSVKLGTTKFEAPNNGTICDTLVVTY